jgi:hypothetical protein
MANAPSGLSLAPLHETEKVECFYKGNKDRSVKKHTVLSRASAQELNKEDVADYFNLLAAVLKIMDEPP